MNASSDIEKNSKILIDKDQFTQLVLILLDNAIKYTQEKENIVVTLNKRKKSTYLTLENTWVSLTDDEVINIFDKFYKANKSWEKEQNSYGLGLSIVSEIVRCNHFDLQVHSKKINKLSL